jgi:hypothetical protein
MSTVNKLRYQKKYRQKPEVKKANAKRMAKRYRTDEGQAYEHTLRVTPRSRYMRARYGSRKRGKAWSLTFEDYRNLVIHPCYYCNKSIANETGSGLDRIDNDGGYSMGNVNPCCADCNRRRSKSMSAEEFRTQTKINGRWEE